MITYSIEFYRLDVVNSAFNRIAEVKTYTGELRFQETLNRVGSAAFTLSIDNVNVKKENLYRYRTQIAIKRRVNGGSPVVVFFGYINHISINRASDSGYVVVECLEYFSHLRSRYAETRLTSTQEVSDHISDYVTAAQNKTNGELLITMGSTETIGDIQDTINPYDTSFGDQILALTDNSTSFDIDTTYTTDSNDLVTGIKINTYIVKGEVRDEVEINLNNIVSYRTDPKESLYNSIVAKGFGTGDETISSPQVDTSSQKAFSLREEVKKYPSISSITELESKAAGLLSEVKSEKWNLMVEIKSSVSSLGYTKFNVGDYLNVNIVEPKSGLTITGNGRVRTREIVFDDYERQYITFDYVA